MGGLGCGEVWYIIENPHFDWDGLVPLNEILMSVELGGKRQGPKTLGRDVGISSRHPHKRAILPYTSKLTQSISPPHNPVCQIPYISSNLILLYCCGGNSKYNSQCVNQLAWREVTPWRHLDTVWKQPSPVVLGRGAGTPGPQGYKEGAQNSSRAGLSLASSLWFQTVQSSWAPSIHRRKNRPTWDSTQIARPIPEAVP